MSKTFTRLTVITVTGLLALGLSACSSTNAPIPAVDSSGNPIPTLPATPENADIKQNNSNELYQTPAELVSSKTVKVPVGKSLSFNVPEKDYSSWTGVSSDTNVATFTAGNILSDSNPQPTIPPLVTGISVGTSTITLTDSKGETFTFTVEVTA